MQDKTGMAESAVVSEVERYIVDAGMRLQGRHAEHKSSA